MASASSLLANVLNYLQVPMGSKYRTASDMTKKSEVDSAAQEHDLVASILAITCDDVCLGAEPFYYKTVADIGTDGKLKLDKLRKELNDVSKWIAFDLLANGHSSYKLKIKENKIIFYPITGEDGGEIKYFLTDSKRVIIKENDKEIKDSIIFINYNKKSLRKVKDKQGYFEIIPTPIQLKNVNNTIRDLVATEASIVRYRKGISRLLRFVSVEVGASLGDQNQDLIDTVSSAINSNSMSLEGMASDMFDDEIPVIPYRKGLGKPEAEYYSTTFDISTMTDLDYITGKLFLGMRFPKTYADFSTKLDSTAVSLIRGDIRYNRMVTATKTLMERTVNDFISNVPFLKESGVEFRLASIPNPEDEEVLSALSNYNDFIKDSYDFIFETPEDKNSVRNKILLYKTIIGDGTSVPSIQKWLKNLDTISSQLPKTEVPASEVSSESAPGFEIPAEGEEIPMNEEEEAPETEEAPE